MNLTDIMLSKRNPHKSVYTLIILIVVIIPQYTQISNHCFTPEANIMCQLYLNKKIFKGLGGAGNESAEQKGFLGQ